MRALALLLISSTAFAGNELSIGSTDRALRSASADAVTGDSYAGGQLAFAHDLDLGTSDVTVAATGALIWGGADGTLFDMTTEVGQTAYLVGLRARYAVVPHLAAGAALQVGAVHTSLALTDAMERTVGDAGWGGVASGALALDLLAVDGDRFRLGLRLELGYVAAAAVALTGRSDRADDDTLRLRMTEASLGRLDLSGPFAGVSLLSDF
jgi:hypothetical protein